MPFTREIAQWVASAPCDWPTAARDAAERGLVDTVGCLIAGAQDAAPQRALRGVGAWGGQGVCSVAGRAAGIDAPWAALVNATAAHALDYDDVLDPAASHVSAVMVPSLLALAEEMDASGAALVDAYIVGVEVQECLAEAVNMVHYSRGWHTTLTLGSASAAAACARLMQLDATRTLHAISLATSMGAGFKRQFGSNAKSFHAGLAAKNGIIAASMAAAGLTADDAPFEGERGFLDLMAGPGAAGFAHVLDRLHAEPAVVRPGLWQKRYPCCASTHRPIDGMLQLMRQHGLQATDIERVETVVSDAAIGNLMYAVPANEMQARFSMPYCIAVAAHDRDLTLGSFRAAALQRAEVMGFLGRVAMTPDPEQPSDVPSTTKSWSRTVVLTRDGRRLSRKVIDPKGHPGNPLSEQELQRKFVDCAQGQTSALSSSYSAWRTASRQPSVRAMCRVVREIRPA
ncbi:MAG: MmgE/PrpD family protein [Burkholderiaceae bacterium]|nr:MAG: MmgE/PrpD family protein [Burkholderiaceae bacterium]